MANKNILQLKDVNEKLSLSDYFILWDFEENVDEPTKKVTLGELIELFSGIASVNGKSEKDIILRSDDISSSGQSNKYITQAEKDKVAKIKTDQPSDTFLNGSGNYTNIPVIDNLTSIDSFTGLSANQGKILKDLNDSLSVLINNITIDAPTTGDSLLKLFNLISSNASLIQDIYLILQSDQGTLDTFQEIVNFIENNRADLDNYVLALEGKASKATGDIEIDHTPAIVILPTWISSIYTEGKAKLRSVLDKIILEIELVKMAYVPLQSGAEGVSIESEGGFTFDSSEGTFDINTSFNQHTYEGNFSASAPQIVISDVMGNGFYFFDNELNVFDNRIEPKGLQYNFTDHSFLADNSLVPKKYVDDKVNQETLKIAVTPFDEADNSAAISPAMIPAIFGKRISTENWAFGKNVSVNGTGEFRVTATGGAYINTPLEVTDNVTINGGITVNGNNIKINGGSIQFTPTKESLEISGATSIDLANKDVIHLTLTGNVTSFDITNPVVGKTYKIYLIQDTVGNRTITNFSAKFKTENNTPVLLSTEANTYDMLQLEIIDTDKITIFPIYSVW